MRNDLHTRRAKLALAALLMTVSLPVATLLFSLTGEAAPGSDKAELIVPVTIPAASGSLEWSEDAAQSASMVLVGSLLIGLGAVVRRTV